MSKLKRWLYNKFLPAWCKDDLLEANKHLTETVEEQRQEIDRLNFYIDGMHEALRRQPKILIRGEVIRE